MTDRVYPASKPNGTAATTNGGTAAAAANGTINPPPAKSHLYNPASHPYRPQPTIPHRRRRSKRRCLCLCCCWSIVLFTALLLLVAIAGCVLYVLYSPRRPSFTVTTLRISRFNLSTNAADDTTRLASTINVTVSAKNPNKKLTFFYDPITIAAVSDEVQIANGSFPGFTSDPKNITVIHSSLSSSSSQVIDADSVKSLRSDLKKKKNNGLALKVVMETEVVVKLEKVKSKKVGIRVTCDGIHGVLPKGKSPPPSIASTSDAKCKVDLRIKIWKWTF